MIHNKLFKKSHALLVASLFLVVLFAGVSAFAADKPLVLSKYPNLKLGFTSQNFAKWLPPTAPNLKKVLDYASEKGFAFIELRDPKASLSLHDAKDVAEYAKQKKIKVIYAMGVGGLDPDYFEVFSRGLANTMVFDGPKYARTGACGNEMPNDPKKQFWTAAEFAQLVRNFNQAGNTAKTFGYTLYIENSYEALAGDGINTFGFADLFGPKGVNANVGFQLDTGNFFGVSRSASSPNDVQKFFEATVNRMGYTHVKTAKDRKSQPVLSDIPLSFDVFLSSLSKNKKVYVAIELSNADTLENAYVNQQKSVDYLLKNF